MYLHTKQKAWSQTGPTWGPQHHQNQELQHRSGPDKKFPLLPKTQEGEIQKERHHPYEMQQNASGVNISQLGIWV